MNQILKHWEHYYFPSFPEHENNTFRNIYVYEALALLYSSGDKSCVDRFISLNDQGINSVQ